MRAKLVVKTKGDLVFCGRCGREVKAAYQAQKPAPCGCVWAIRPRDGQLCALAKR